jgi:hypothetical protein
MNMDELREWFGFIGKLILECICLAVWIIMAWGLHGYLVRIFPLEGIPELMLYALEIMFYSATLFHLTRLLFWPHKRSQTPRWWQ